MATPQRELLLGTLAFRISSAKLMLQHHGQKLTPQDLKQLDRLLAECHEFVTQGSLF